MIRRKEAQRPATEGELARATELIRAACAESGVVPEVDARSYIDPEDEDEVEVTLLTIRVTSRLPDAEYIALMSSVGDRLAEAGLLAPQTPLLFTFRP